MKNGITLGNIPMVNESTSGENFANKNDSRFAVNRQMTPQRAD